MSKEEKEFDELINEMFSDNFFEAWKRGEERTMAAIVTRDGCPKCGSREYPCGCWK